MKKVFVDTSAWIAFLDSNDANHQSIKKFLQSSLGKVRMITTDYVIYETLTYLNCSLKNIGLARDFYYKVKDSVGVEVVPITSNVSETSLDEYFFKYDDKYLSVVDATSFCIMKKLGLIEVLTLDDHFTKVGFIPVI